MQVSTLPSFRPRILAWLILTSSHFDHHYPSLQFFVLDGLSSDVDNSTLFFSLLARESTSRDTFVSWVFPSAKQSGLFPSVFQPLLSMSLSTPSVPILAGLMFTMVSVRSCRFQLRLGISQAISRPSGEWWSSVVTQCQSAAFWSLGSLEQARKWSLGTKEQWSEFFVSLDFRARIREPNKWINSE